MDAAFFNEGAADKQVIKSLSNEIERMRNIIMAKVIKSADGKYFRVHQFEELTEAEFNQELDCAREKLSELEAIAPVPADQPAETPSVPAPVADQPAAAAVETAAPTNATPTDQAAAAPDPAPVADPVVLS